MYEIIDMVFGYQGVRFVKCWGSKALMVAGLVLMIWFMRSLIIAALKSIGSEMWMRIGYGNTKKTKSFSRKVGLFAKDEKKGEDEHVSYCRPFWSHEVRIKCPKSITPSAVEEKKKEISHFFFGDENEIAITRKEGRVLRMHSHKMFPDFLFEETVEEVDKAVTKKRCRVPLYQGRNPYGILIMEGDDKSCSIAVGAPGAGKSLSLEAVHFSIARYDKDASITIFDSSGVDYAHLYGGNTFIIRTHDELLTRMLEIKSECEIRRNKMMALTEKTGRKVSSRAVYEKMTLERMPSLVLIIDEAQLVFDSKAAAKGSPQAKIIEVYKELVTANRKFGFLSFLGSVESKAGELAIPFNSVATRIAGALPFAETSRTLLGSDIAFSTSLKRGRLAIRVPGEDGDLGQHGLIVQFPKSFKSKKRKDHAAAGAAGTPRTEAEGVGPQGDKKGS